MLHLPSPSDLRRALSALALALASAGPALAAPVEIAPSPMANATAEAVKANLMFVLDDSGSMGSDYVPDEVEAVRPLRCFGYSGYNRLFFNPAMTYLAPLDANGASMGNANFNAARRDGYNAGSPVDNLAEPDNLSTEPTILQQEAVSNTTTVEGPFACGAITDAACSIAPVVTQQREGDQLTSTVSTYVRGDVAGRTCSAAADSCTRTTTTVTTVVNVIAESRYYWSTLIGGRANDCTDANYEVVSDPGALSAAQRQNYANWYSYYRTRMLTMRSAAGRVFNNVDGTRFRVGFSTISEQGVANGAKFLNVDDFGDAQRQAFFQRLYATQPGGFTPLRPALAKIGKYFAAKAPGQAVDPMQYACQRNFTILSTDGYWNTRGEPAGGWKPTGLTGAPIGNTDGGTTPRPLRDDGRALNGNWVTGGAGVSNSLADIAAYFYDTDLRTPALGNCNGAVAGQQVCENVVGISGRDDATHQHMTLFTLGLGVAGLLQYQADYETSTSGDYFGIRNGTRPWPNPLSDNVGGNADPGDTVTTRIDDLWHAAVNGRGTYYSANNPGELVTSLTRTLQQINEAQGSGAAAATSTIKPVVGDNLVFRGRYVGSSGELVASALNVQTGAVGGDLWTTDNTLPTMVAPAADTRRILYAGGGGLRAFTYGNLAADGLGRWFANRCAGDLPLSQCATLGAAGVALVNNGANVVNFLRGQTGLEDRAANPEGQRVFRARRVTASGGVTPLGDIVNAAPVYLKKPPFRYGDDGYAAFAAANANRQAAVYVAANDGMLHAFNADNGRELWAFVPTMAMREMARLADTAYEANHRYFVDATPTLGDVQIGGQWRTVLVGGLGAGGRGYYALDVTDPDAPRLLWEISAQDDTAFGDDDLGLSYGNPVITKNAAGRWVVAFSSGYNNVEPGDGQGYLYVRDVGSGQAISKIGTGAGDGGTPSNLGRIEGWVDADTDNTSLRMYGGDMQGNLWRFDYDNQVGAGGTEATLLGQARAPGGAVQPITVKPTLAQVGIGDDAVPVVIVGTGRYLGLPDLTDDTVQSIYVVKDTLTADGLGVLRDAPGMRQNTLSTVGDERTIADGDAAQIDWATDAGWFVDLTLSNGERVNVDVAQTGRTLIVASNVPGASVCNEGGTSWFYSFDLENGKVNTSAPLPALTAGLNLVQVGETLRVIQWDVAGRWVVRDPKPGANAPPENVQRTSWRELVE